MSNRAWVTLATNDSYGLGALVLAHSLRRAESAYPAVVLITPSVTEAMRDRLSAVFAQVVTVDVLDSRDAAHLALLQRPELGITFTKIHCWSLTQYEKCVFLDADTLVVQNCDELFEREELSAAPDVGWPDCFNSGVFVYKPSNETFEQLIKFAQERGSFDGGDQGLLNSFFSDWAHGDISKHLPFLYNVTSAAFYSYLPALKHYGQNLKIIHFIGIAKPWLQQFNWESRTVEAPDHIRGLLQLWWDLFVGQVHPQLDVAMGGVQSPPALPPQDVGHHYMPTVDPESEFPWHHPDAQIQEENRKDDINLEEFHDPWEIYGGQIPYKQEDVPPVQSFSGRVEDHEEIKKYAWEFKAQESTPQHNYQEQRHNQFESHHQDYHQNHPDHTWESHSHDQSAHSHHHPTHEQHYHNDCHQHDYHQDQSHHHDHHAHHHYEHGQAHINQAHEHYYHEHQGQDDHQTHIHSHSSHNDQTIPIHYDSNHYYSETDSSKLTSHRVEQVHHVHLEHETNLSLHKLKEDSEKANEVMNGDISDSDSDYYEEIKPRHPYDGFYLRHKPTIDANGRKVCSHEVPPTPSPSSPPESESEYGTPDLTIEETTVTDCDQSGVAGNLARVTPGAVGTQREALDELTRRQGWEAGNIDYMGADSFDNILAKISQTLSQPKPQPKQPSPPKEQPKEAPAPAPVEVAQEAVVAAVEPPVEAQAPGEAPVAAPAQPDAVPVPASEANAELVAAPEAPAAGAPAPPAVAEAKPSPAEPAPVASQPEPVAPAEIPATVEAVAAPAAEPSVEPSEIPATVEAIAPGEAPQSADVPVSVESAAAPEVAKDEPKTETALPPTPPVTPKSTPEATPVSERAPTLESVEAQPASVEASSPPATVEAPAAPATVEAPAVPAAVEAPAVPAAVEAPEAPVTTEATVAPATTEAPVAPATSEVPTTVETPPSPASVEAPVAPAAAIPLEAPVAPAPSEAPVAPTPVEAPSAPVEAPVAPAPSEVPTTVEAPPTAASVEAPVAPAAATPVEAIIAPAPSEAPAAPTPVEAPSAPVEAPVVPTPVAAAEVTPVVASEVPPTEAKDPEPVVEAKKEEAPVEASSEPAAAAEAPAPATPEKPSAAQSLSASTDSPPLANTPSKEEAPALPAAKSEERRKVGKLQLSPPAVADPLPTPDSELEDAATLAQSIIASELSTPTVTEAEPATPSSPSAPTQDKRLSVDAPEVPTPPVGASLEQIGVKSKAKPTTAAQIESSVSEKSEPATPTEEKKDAPKKKIVKKVKKDAGATGGADAPVPPPRKKEKKPKEK